MLIAFSSIFGLIVGSFLNVVILRLPKGESLSGRSHCPFCHRILKPTDLFPLFSFIFLRGKCAGCKKKISWRYPLIELVAGLGFGLLAWFFSPENFFGFLELVRALVFFSVLLAVFIIDLENYIIPDAILLWGGGIILAISLGMDLFFGQLFAFWTGYVFEGIFAGIAASLPLFIIWLWSKGRWMGFGDVKYVIFLGLFLGWPHVWVAWFLAFFSGSLFSLPLLIFKKKQLSSKLPFGCFLSFGAFLAIFLSEKIIVWYLGLLGF